MVKYVVVIACCVLLNGCFSIEVRWNRLRVGVLEYEKRARGSDYVTREGTLGFQFNWAPDVDWHSLLNRNDSEQKEN